VNKYKKNILKYTGLIIGAAILLVVVIFIEQKQGRNISDIFDAVQVGSESYTKLADDDSQ